MAAYYRFDTQEKIIGQLTVLVNDCDETVKSQKLPTLLIRGRIRSPSKRFVQLRMIQLAGWTKIAPI